MSNVCEVYFKIEGSRDNLVTFKKLLEISDTSIGDLVPYLNRDQHKTFCVFNVTLYDGYLALGACAEYNPNKLGIQALSKEYPDLLFKVHYSETTLQFFGSFQIKDECILKEEYFSELDYLLRYNDEFIKEKEHIETMNYDEFVTEYSEEITYVQHPDCLLEIFIINRIRDDDLPLFINCKWMDKEAQIEYKRRLAGNQVSRKEALQ